MGRSRPRSPWSRATCRRSSSCSAGALLPGLEPLDELRIDDDAGRTIVSASTNEASVRGEGSGGTVDAATRLGQLVAERAKAAGIDKVVFDRGGYLYHGRVAAVAAAAREAGLEF